MAKKLQYKNNKRALHSATEPDLSVTPIKKPLPGPLKGLTPTQDRYIKAIQSFQLVFAIGPAGTGKSFVAATYAAQQLIDKRVDRVILTRPAVEVGASMGFLPGTIEEKYEPYLEPFKNAMIRQMGKSHYEYAIKAEQILPRPLAYMRGSSFDDAIIILDEAQNTTPAEMLMFLTRIGKNCTVIVNGDIQQCDLNIKSGLEDAIDKVSWIPSVKVIEFSEDDIVRSGIVKEILQAYRQRK